MVLRVIALILLVLNLFTAGCLWEAIRDMLAWRRSRKNGVLRVLVRGAVRQEALRQVKHILALLGVVGVIPYLVALVSIGMLLGVNSLLDLISRRRSMRLAQVKLT